jgi:hypothetical protein
MYEETCSLIEVVFFSIEHFFFFFKCKILRMIYNTFCYSFKKKNLASRIIYLFTFQVLVLVVVGGRNNRQKRVYVSCSTPTCTHVNRWENGNGDLIHEGGGRTAYPVAVVRSAQCGTFYREPNYVP